MNLFDKTKTNNLWYKSHRWTREPDLLAQDFLYGKKEFSVTTQMAFEKHLKELKNYKCA